MGHVGEIGRESSMEDASVVMFSFFPFPSSIYCHDDP